MPILSVGRLATKLAATSFAASIRLGVKSCASILPLTSIASTMSTPSPLTSSSSFLVCGLASATIIQAMHSNRHINGRCRNLVFQERRFFTLSTDEISTLACLPDCLAKCHQASSGSSANKASIHGYPKLIFLK